MIPYVNVWTGFDNPQSVARAGAAGGVLRNTGILFESDNLTGYPTLDATAANTYGAAFGIDLLSPEFTHQLILEAAVLQVFGDPDLRNAAGDQYGIGARYQVPISNATLLRFDVMHGLFDNAPDVTGAAPNSAGNSSEPGRPRPPGSPCPDNAARKNPGNLLEIRALSCLT